MPKTVPRRAKLLAKDANHTRTVRRRVEEGGEKKLVEKTQKKHPWWKATADGYAFYIRLARFVEFAKGQTTVVVPSLDKLPTVIDTLIAAVRNGELDAQLAAASTKPQKKAAKK